MISTGVFRKAMHQIAAQKGDFALFALFRRADGLGKWDLVVSAPWLKDGRLKMLGKFVDLLTRSIGRKSLLQLARVEPIPSNNPTVQFILDNLPVDDGERRIQNTDLFGLEIEEAIILRAMRPNRKRPTRKVLHPVGAGASARRA